MAGGAHVGKRGAAHTFTTCRQRVEVDLQDGQQRIGLGHRVLEEAAPSRSPRAADQVDAAPFRLQWRAAILVRPLAWEKNGD